MTSLSAKHVLRTVHFQLEYTTTVLGDVAMEAQIACRQCNNKMAIPLVMRLVHKAHTRSLVTGLAEVGRRHHHHSIHHPVQQVHEHTPQIVCQQASKVCASSTQQRQLLGHRNNCDIPWKRQPHVTAVLDGLFYYCHISSTNS